MVSPRYIVLPSEQTTAKASHSRQQKWERGQKKAKNRGKRACTNYKVVEHRSKKSKKCLQQNLGRVVLNAVLGHIMKGED